MRYATLVTSAAWGPFWPWTTSNSTRSPSARDLNPVPEIALKWTKTSGPPSREMKPKPFASLNHFTVPVMRAMTVPLSLTGELTEPRFPVAMGKRAKRGSPLSPPLLTRDPCCSRLRSAKFGKFCASVWTGGPAGLRLRRRRLRNAQCDRSCDIAGLRVTSAAGGAVRDHARSCPNTMGN